VKLLLDENVSDRIIPSIADLFPGSTHIKSVGLKEAEDSAVWDWAKRHEFTIVSN
jgi:predicted nuclease of predicted toxin-antitoxin system